MLVLTQGLEKTAKYFPHRVCIQFKQGDSLTQYTYRQIYDLSLKVGRWLFQIGIKAEERIAILLENRPQWGVIYFGIQFCGGTAVPLDIQSKFEEVEYILKDAQCRALFTSSAVSFIGKLKTLDFLEKIVVVDGQDARGKIVTFSDAISAASDKTVLPARQPHQLASIIYTSGTTDLPKGVMLTHKNFYSNFLSIKRVNILQPYDNMLSILPLHHSYPFLVTLIAPLFLGARITYLDTLKADEMSKCLNEEKITIMVVVPQILHLFHRRITEHFRSLPLVFRLLINFTIEILWMFRCVFKVNLSKLVFSKLHSRLGKNLRFLVSGGAKLDEKVARFFFKLGFHIIEGYGLTEASPVVSLNPFKQPKIGSVGKPLPDVEVKIFDPDREGLGQILIKGPNVMKGYYHLKEETEAVLKGGWLYSGDFGYKDKTGYIYIKGRLKETIVLSSGKNISPEEVEAHYSKSPFIKELCVLPDASQELLVAVVVPDVEYFKKEGETNIYQIMKWRLEYLSQGLPSYKRIRNFVLVSDGLPRTRLGKIQRFKVSQIYQEHLEKKAPKREDERVELSATQKRVLDILRKTRKVEKISLQDHLELDL
ncbi:MAG: AMP-binding protein, partial [Candidatus Omnitrophota bacterium]